MHETLRSLPSPPATITTFKHSPPSAQISYSFPSIISRPSTTLKPPPQLLNLPLRKRRLRAPVPSNQQPHQTPFRRNGPRTGPLTLLVLHAMLGEDWAFLGGWIGAEVVEHGEFAGVEDGGRGIVAGDDGGGDGVGGDH